MPLCTCEVLKLALISEQWNRIENIVPDHRYVMVYYCMWCWIQASLPSSQGPSSGPGGQVEDKCRVTEQNPPGVTSGSFIEAKGKVLLQTSGQ